MDYLTLRRQVEELGQAFACRPLVARAIDAAGRSLFLRLKFKDGMADLVLNLDSPNQGMRLTNHCQELDKSTSLVRTANRLLINGRLNSITMAGSEADNRFDRVVKLHFVVIDNFFGNRSDFYIFCEFTGRIADIFICDDDLKILDRMSRTSNNLIGGSYRLPDTVPLLNPFSAEQTALERAFSAPREEWKNLVGCVSPQIEAEVAFRTPATAESTIGAKRAAVFSALCAEAVGAGPVRAYLENGRLKALAPCELRHIAEAPYQTFPDVNSAVNWVEERLSLPRRLNEARKRVIAAFQRDLKQKTVLLDDQKRLQEKYAGADQYQNQGNLLVANLYRVKQGCRSIEIDDWQTGGKVVLELDPTKTPAANAQRFFGLYKKARRGSVEVEKRIEALLGEIGWLREQIWLAENAVDEADLQIEEKTGTYRKDTKKSRPEANSGRKVRQNLKPTLEIEGCRYYIGRNAKQNDVLTFQTGRRGDYWFHANEVPGAHVIVKKPEGEISETDLWRGATLAAWFSFARESSKVAVDFTDVAYVKKIPGGGAGRVSYTHQKTLMVNPADALPLVKLAEEQAEKFSLPCSAQNGLIAQKI